MDIWGNRQSALGYQTNDGGIDSYGVDHSGFDTRDELQYQSARSNREQQLMKNYNNQGITGNYPQYGTNFWGSSPDNNYGFGNSQISKNIENMSGSLPPDNLTTNQNVSLNNNNFSDKALVERMTPVIKKMEKPLDYIYIDSMWNKTTGAGANIDDWETFRDIDWQINDRQATEEETRATFDYFDEITSKGKSNVDAAGNLLEKNNYTADSYKDQSQLRLPSGATERLLRSHLDQDVQYLRREFPGFATFPPELQNVLLDIKFNTGNVSEQKWPKLRKAIAEKDISGIVNNVHRRDVDRKRNYWTEQQIRNIRSW